MKPADIRWRRGGLEEAGRDERSLIKLPDDVELKQVPDDRTLSTDAGTRRLDGMISARAPSCFLQGAPNVARLFPDYPATEADYFKRTRKLPSHARDRHPQVDPGAPSLARGQLLQGLYQGQRAVHARIGDRSGISSAACPGASPNMSG